MVEPIQVPKTRNFQLDFFRGVALMVVFINHMPDNPWFWYTPSRFGLSDAAEIFVFLSGYASALAYGRCFEVAGLRLGTIRVLHRCWQIYQAHLASFVLLALVCVIGNRWVPEIDDIQRLNIAYFFDTTQQAIFDLFTLAYVPNYFDILPMYLVMMSWLPIFWALSRLHVAVALLGSVGLYWAALHYGWELTADQTSGRPWYFNPFNWQLMFFTGFAFGAGWLRVTAGRRWLLAICLLLVLVSIPLEHEPTYSRVLFWGELRARLEPWLDKSHLSLLRWLHLLALAYLMNRFCNWRSEWLTKTLSRAIVTMGQQSLPIFVFSMMLSYGGGIALDRFGREAPLETALVNLSGLGLMLMGGQMLSWLNRKPWKAASIQESDHANNHQSWAGQAVAFPLMIGLAIFPVLLLRQQTFSGAVPADTVVLSPQSEAIRPVNALESDVDSEMSVENGQQL